MSKMDYVDNRDEQADLRAGWLAEQETKLVRDRIAEVLRKYNVTLPDAPLDALTAAMERMGAKHRGLLKPASQAPKLPDITTPEGAKASREAADYYRNTLKPFA